MIHYHGTPIGGSRQDGARFFVGRHALVPFSYSSDMPSVAEYCQSFVLDNGAYTVWKQGGKLDAAAYIDWVRDWCRHPGFDWALIPDVIDGTEADNRRLVEEWCDAGLARYGCPIWHMHESLDWLVQVCNEWPTVAIGSSGQWPTPGTVSWWRRMSEAMDAICIEGRPPAKLHGLRMLDPAVFSHLPLSSADSTNAAVNSGSLGRFGSYLPPTRAQRAAVIADRIEAHNSAPVWQCPGVQSSLLEVI